MAVKVLKCRVCGGVVPASVWVKHLGSHIELPKRPRTGASYPDFKRMYPESEMGFQEWLKWYDRVWHEYEKNLEGLKKRFFMPAGEKRTFGDWFKENEKFVKEVFC